MMWVPPGWWLHSKIMMVPISVMPAVSPALAPQSRSIRALVWGIDPAGSPDRMSRSHRAGGQVDAEPLGLLGQAQGVGGGGGDHGGPEVDDLSDPAVGGLGAAGDVQGAQLLQPVVQAPEPDEGAVAEGDIGGVRRTDPEPPQAVAPHLGLPGPVLGRVQHPDGLAAGGARGGVPADGRLPPGHRQQPERRLLAPGRPSTARGSAWAAGAGRPATGAGRGRTRPP